MGGKGFSFLGGLFIPKFIFDLSPKVFDWGDPPQPPEF